MGAGSSSAVSVAPGADGEILLANSGATAGLSFGANPANLKNLLINGNFDFWQRKTSHSFAGGAGFSFTADRWRLVADLASGGGTNSRDTTAFPSNKSICCWRFNTTVAEASLGTSKHLFLEQRIEGPVFRHFAGKQVTLSFFVRGNKLGTYGVCIVNPSGTRSYVASYTLDAVSVWEKKVITFTHDEAGAWLYGPGDLGCLVRFTLGAGSAFRTGTQNAWQSANFLGPTAQVNLLDTVGNDFKISQVQLERGPAASEFEAPSPTIELARCQRYYHKSYFLTTDPGTATSAQEMRYVAPSSAGEASPPMFYPVEMMVEPTKTFYSPQSGAAGKRRNYSTGLDENCFGTNTSGPRLHCGGPSHATGHLYGYHYTAEAEL